MPDGDNVTTKKQLTARECAAYLNGIFPERGAVIDAMLVASVAETHAVLLGPPGTAKSALTRALSALFGFTGEHYFEYLLTRFTEPSEVMGPVDPAAFKAGFYKRITTGKLPRAKVAFLDETFKCNSAMLNSLLTIMNEKTYDDGSGPKPVPLVSLFGASNELPEGPELDALYDRFLVRIHVDYLVEQDNFRTMLRGSRGARPTLPGVLDIEAANVAARAVTITGDTEDALVNLAWACKKDRIQVSDRRWVQCQRIIQAAAHIDGRTDTNPDDLDALEHVLWHKPDERVQVSKIIQTVVNPSGAKAVEELDMAKEAFDRLPDEAAAKNDPAAVGVIGPINKDLREIVKRLELLGSSKKVKAALDEAKRMQAQSAKLAMLAAGMEV